MQQKVLDDASSRCAFIYCIINVVFATSIWGQAAASPWWTYGRMDMVPLWSHVPSCSPHLSKLLFSDVWVTFSNTNLDLFVGLIPVKILEEWKGKGTTSERLCSLLCKEIYGWFQRLAVVPYFVRKPGFFHVENCVCCLGLHRLRAGAEVSINI